MEQQRFLQIHSMLVEQHAIQNIHNIKVFVCLDVDYLLNEHRINKEEALEMRVHLSDLVDESNQELVCLSSVYRSTDSTGATVQEHNDMRTELLTKLKRRLWQPSTLGNYS